MFTLKLYRRHEQSGTKMHKVIAAQRVVVMEIGKEGSALEVRAFQSDQNNDYHVYYIGKTEEGMDAHGGEDLHLDSNSWWGWGLLENLEGNTTEHYRPHNYG